MTKKRCEQNQELKGTLKPYQKDKRDILKHVARLRKIKSKNK